jgi:hypothetical protein
MVAGRRNHFLIYGVDTGVRPFLSCDCNANSRRCLEAEWVSKSKKPRSGLYERNVVVLSLAPQRVLAVFGLRFRIVGLQNSALLGDVVFMEDAEAGRSLFVRFAPAPGLKRAAFWTPRRSSGSNAWKISDLSTA